MSSKVHKRSNTKGVVAGTLGALGLIALSTEAVSANNQVLVQKGDTVWGIAQQHGLTTSALEQANGSSIKKVNDSVDLIQAGQQLTLPSSQKTTNNVQADTYVVKRGDTLSTIANRFNVSVSDLVAWNHISNPNLIYVGQRLSLRANGTSAAVSSSAPVNNNVTETSANNVTPVVPATTNAANNNNVQGTTTTVTTSTTPVSQQPTVQSAGSSTAVVSEANASATATIQTVASSAPVSQQGAQQTVASNQQQTFNLNLAAQQQLAQEYGQSFVAVPNDGSQVTNNSANQGTTNQTAGQTTQQASQPATSQPTNNQQTTTNPQAGSVVGLATQIASTNSVPYVWGR